MYCGVPTTIPLSVSCSALAACSARAMPKSATTAWPAGQHDVLGLDVPMDDPVLVGVLQGAADFAGDLERGVERKLLFPREPLPEGLALGERHDVVQQAAGLPRVIQRENVGVLECRGDLDLAEEPLAAEDGRQLGLEQLDGDAPVVLQVLGEKDDRHPTAAKLSLDPVSIAERRRELLEEFHGRPFPPVEPMCPALSGLARNRPSRPRVSSPQRDGGPDQHNPEGKGDQAAQPPVPPAVLPEVVTAQKQHHQRDAIGDA